MIIISMKLAWAKASNDHRTQYVWHVGERFPILTPWLEYVERLYADGEELDRLSELLPIGDPRAKAADVVSPDANYACEMLLAVYEHGGPDAKS